MTELLLFVVVLVHAFFANREGKRLLAMNAAKQREIDRLLEALVATTRPAPMWMTDQPPGPPDVPENAIWDEAGLFFYEAPEDE